MSETVKDQSEIAAGKLRSLIRMAVHKGIGIPMPRNTAYLILDALAASQAETLELREERDTLRERLDASATGMAKLNDRIAELEQERDLARRLRDQYRKAWERERRHSETGVWDDPPDVPTGDTP